jgi:hypothetical protein
VPAYIITSSVLFYIEEFSPDCLSALGKRPAVFVKTFSEQSAYPVLITDFTDKEIQDHRVRQLMMDCLAARIDFRSSGESNFNTSTMLLISL